MNDEQAGPPEPPTVPVPPVPPVPPAPTVPTPVTQGPIDWTPRDPSAGAPPPPPQSPPQWTPPSAAATGVMPTVPTGPPTAAPAGPPTGPPTAPPGAWNQPQPAGPSPASSPPPTSKKTGLIIAVLVVIALLIGGAAAAAVVLIDSGPNLTLDIEVCEIAADGTMTASGSVENTSGSTADVDVEVTFRNDATSSIVDTDSLDLIVAGDAGERWSLSGTAGDEVQRVTCDVTVED